MKTHYSISELLEMNLEKFPKTNRAILYKVEREKWSFIEASCQGGKNGKRREYAPPPEVLKLIQAKKLNEVLGGLSDLPAPLSSYEEKGGEEAGLPSPDVRGGRLDGATTAVRIGTTRGFVCGRAGNGGIGCVEGGGDDDCFDAGEDAWLRAYCEAVFFGCRRARRRWEAAERTDHQAVVCGAGI